MSENEKVDYNKKEKEIIERDGFNADAILSQRNKRGYVRLSCGLTFDVTVDPDNAREIAQSIYRAAEAAETDEFIFDFVKSIGAGDGGAANMLIDFREKRAEFAERRETEKRDQENKGAE